MLWKFISVDGAWIVLFMFGLGSAGWFYQHVLYTFMLVVVVAVAIQSHLRTAGTLHLLLSKRWENWRKQVYSLPVVVQHENHSREDRKPPSLDFPAKWGVLSMRGTMANLSSSSLPQPQTTFLLVLVLIQLWEPVMIIRACQVSGLSRFSCEIKNGVWRGIFFWILWICLLENMISANSSAISTYFLHLTLFPTCISVVLYRKVINWLFSVILP